jgi:hypothetical protein
LEFKESYSYLTFVFVSSGKPGFSIAWWINGLLIPELYLERGKVSNTLQSM